MKARLCCSSSTSARSQECRSITCTCDAAAAAHGKLSDMLRQNQGKAAAVTKHKKKKKNSKKKQSKGKCLAQLTKLLQEAVAAATFA